ncbi:DUF547 domain-containing protein [Rhodocaloribacter sp.]
MKTPRKTPAAFDHSRFGEILATFVDARGRVDYAGLKRSGALDPYLALLDAATPEAMPPNERLAFWINVYNAWTLRLILDHYPVRSIKRITPVRLPGISLYLPKLNSPWEYRIVRAGGRRLTLNEVEHEIIRKAFDEPRIHFALVCAARSCPKLRREAFTGPRLDAQLDDQARDFLHDAAKNRIPDAPGVIRLSSIFRWFRRDFARDDRGLQAFLAPYFDGDVRERLRRGAYRVRYLRYDWRLNER